MTACIGRAIALAILVASLGCVSRPGTGLESGPNRWSGKAGSGASPANQQSGQGFGLKKVTGREEPLRLIARDGTVCAASKKKYESTVLGTSTWCNWIDQKR